MNDELMNLIARVHAHDEKHGDHSRPPAKETDIEALTRSVQERFGAALPEQYLDFLRRTDGLNHDGLFVYDTKSSPDNRTLHDFWQGFVPTNELWRENPENRQYLFLAMTTWTCTPWIYQTTAFKAWTGSRTTDLTPTHRSTT